MTALVMPMLVGFCGLGVDAAYWFYWQQELRAAADIASFDAAVALNAGDSDTAISDAATTAAKANGWHYGNGTITENHPPKKGKHQNSKSVEVTLTEDMPRYFTALFLSTPVTIEARSVATTEGAHDACVIALGSSGTDISMSGGADVSSPNCDIVADSSSTSGISMSGGATTTTPCLVSVGGIKISGGASADLNSCTSPTTNASPATDPYASVAQPTASGSCITYSGQATLSPGYYCSGLSISGGKSVTFQSGTYYIDGGNFSLSGGATVTGSGVTIFVAQNHNVSISGGATATLSAPTSGTYSGLVFFGDRSGSGTNTFSGGATTTITGAIYFPTQTMNYSGGNKTNSTCTQLIAKTISFSGGVNFGAACEGDGVSTINVADGGQGSVQIAE